MCNAAKTLAGLTVCVTRPASEARILSERIQKVRGETIIMSVMEIVEKSNAAACLQDVYQTEPNIVIYVSGNAARIAMQLSAQQDKQSLSNRKIAAIGASTAGVLREHGLDVNILSESSRFTTESLLASPDLQNIRGCRVLIMRGQGGRAYLGNELQQRGAEVSYCELYKRQLPNNFNQNNFVELDKSKNIMLCTSIEIMHNLLKLAGAKYETIVKNIPLLVVSARIQKEAVRLGFQSDILVSKNATDQAVIACLLQWYAAKEK